MVLYEELFNWMLTKISQNFKCNDATVSITIYDQYGFQVLIKNTGKYVTYPIIEDKLDEDSFLVVF